MNNLITNAIKFTESGGKISVKVDKIEGSGKGELEVVVKDTGRGIPQEDLHHIFERFYRVSEKSTSDATTQEGTGIGLSLTKELVEILGGSIRVKSEVSWGTVFSLTFPISNNASVLLEPTKREKQSDLEFQQPLDEVLIEPTIENSDKPLL